jgi:monomeric sarcosine oxidase
MTAGVRHVVVVGAGAFGVWAAFRLHAAGCRVTLVDAYGAGNSRSSSGDESRILRCGYGLDEIYSRMARQSLDSWRACETLLPGAIWHPCGVLWMAAGDDAYTAATRRTLDAGGYSAAVLDAAALQARFPILSTGGIATALFELDAGVLMARRAVQWIAGHLARVGVRLLRGRVVPIASSRRIRAVELTDGRQLAADAFVFACGAWLPRVFPSSLDGRIRPTRQVVVYFGVPPGDERFGASHMPAWVDFPAGIYGVPDIEGRGVKVGLDAHGAILDPDTADRTPDHASVEQARAWLAARMPALADAPVVETRVCQYENTATGDFLIDRHPDHDNVWIAGGGSGHGFKHGPAVGELVARLVMTETTVDEPRFSFARKTAGAHRQVY